MCQPRKPTARQLEASRPRGSGLVQLAAAFEARQAYGMSTPERSAQNRINTDTGRRAHILEAFHRAQPHSRLIAVSNTTTHCGSTLLSFMPGESSITR